MTVNRLVKLAVAGWVLPYPSSYISHFQIRVNNQYMQILQTFYKNIIWKTSKNSLINQVRLINNCKSLGEVVSGRLDFAVSIAIYYISHFQIRVNNR